MTLKSIAPAIACATLMFAAAGVSPALAQAEPQAGPPALGPEPLPMQPGAEEVSETELDQFAAAVVEVDTVLEEYIPRLQEVQGQPEEAPLQQEAQAELSEAIEGQGLTVTRYNEIAEAAEADPALAERLTEKIQ
jgi:hypothetical protein